MADKTLFLAQVMTFGDIEDVVQAQRYFPESEFIRVLTAAPANVFDPWSWSYWHVVLGRAPAPEMPPDWFGFRRARTSIGWKESGPPHPDPV